MSEQNPSGSKEGLAAALKASAVAHPAAPPGSAEEQLDLHDLLGLRKPVPQASDAGAVGPIRRGGPGRPPGVRNRRTEEWINYLLGRYTSPVEVMLRIANMGVEELRSALNCSAVDALDIILKAANYSAPFVHARSPEIGVIDPARVAWGGSPEPPRPLPGDAARDVTPATIIDADGSDAAA
jgi:hypothetical protein